MKNFFPLCFLIVFLNSCQNEPVFNPLEYNSNLTIKQNLVNGVSVLEILNFKGYKPSTFFKRPGDTELISMKSLFSDMLIYFA